MNLDHIFSLITFATGALFYVMFITTLRRRLRRCIVVAKKWRREGQWSRSTTPRQGNRS
jgi:hypothetical protein